MIVVCPWDQQKGPRLYRTRDDVDREKQEMEDEQMNCVAVQKPKSKEELDEVLRSVALAVSENCCSRTLSWKAWVSIAFAAIRLVSVEVYVFKGG